MEHDNYASKVMVLSEVTILKVGVESTMLNLFINRQGGVWWWWCRGWGVTLGVHMNTGDIHYLVKQ